MIVAWKLKATGLSEWHNYEIDLQLVLDLDRATRDANRINTKISLFDLCMSRVSSIFNPHIRLDRFGLTVERQITGDNPMIRSCLLDLHGVKADERIGFTLQDLCMHGVLDFRLLLRTQFVLAQASACERQRQRILARNHCH